MNYFDAFGLPGVVTRMFNNYGPRQNPRYVTGTIITQALERPEIELGQLEPLRDFCFCTDGVRGHLTVAAKGVPGDVYVYGQGENISMADWSQKIIEVGEANGFWPAGRHVVTTEARYRPGASEVMALRVGYEKLNRETGWEPKVSWDEGVLHTIRWYAENRDRWIGRVDWLNPKAMTRVLVTGGGGFLGSHLVDRLRERGDDPFVARRADYDLTHERDAARLFDDAKPELVFHLAAEVGGIGANRANPGRYWFANLQMGVNVLEQARLHGVAKLVDRRHGLRLPEVHAGPVPRGRPLERLPRGDERAVRRREEDAARRRAGLPRAVRHERDLPAAGEPVRAARQLRPARRRT